MMERCPYCFKPLPDGGECECHYEDSPNARIEEALRPGTIVGACYQIGAVLGQGGFGITYRGYDLDMQKVVAIKEFYPQGMVVRYGNITGEPVSGGRSNVVQTVNTEGKNVFRKSLDLFYREAVALGKLSKQPNVVHAYRIFRENGTAYIVMDFVEGQSLKAMIRERGRIPEEELLPLLEPVLTALEKVHQEGILHRDIAPDNIMIENGEPILLDFGAARVEEAHHSSLVIGKKGYSSYEQIAGGTQDRRSDIYAMGATYYSALSGIVPQDAAMRMMRDEVIPLKKLAPGTCEKTSDAVAKAMALRPEDRWNTAAEFRDALRGNSGDEEKEPVYLAAVKLMKNRTEEGYSGARILFGQIAGYKDSDQLAEECGRKAAELRDRSRQVKQDQTKIRIPDVPITDPPINDIPPKKANKLPVLLAAAAVLGIAVFFVLRSGMFSGKTDNKLPEIPQSAAVYTETKQVDPTKTHVPDTDTPIPTLTDTPVPTSTDTPVPTSTDTPVPTSTDTPVPTSTDTPVPTSTETPKPTSTKTPKPAPTDTPKPSPTKTPVPTAVDPEKLTQMGYDAFWNNEYEKAMDYFLPAAEAGNADSRFWLGQMYEYGLGVEQSWKKAAEYYQLSADQGNPNAQYSLGCRYEFGEGVSQSYETAAKYFQLSADQGNFYAQYRLGRLYELGLGVAQSYETAKKYYQLSADQDFDEAIEALKNLPDSAASTAPAAAIDPADLAQKGEDAYNAGEYDTALEYLIPAAEAGDAGAQFRLGHMYYKGLGVGLSYKTAVKYFQMAADQGNADAQFWLGNAYKDGYGVTRSAKTAVKYFQMAADQGHAPAQNNLGYMFKEGKGVTQSYEMAVKYFQMAADQHDAVAQNWLASMYEYGYGVPQSYETAVKYYQMAADQGNESAAESLQRLAGEAITSKPAAANPPTPTATPRPKAAEAMTPAPVWGIVDLVGSSVNVRSTPGTSGTKIRSYSHGSKLEFTGDSAVINGDTWLSVRTENGEDGWIFGPYFATATPLPADLLTISSAEWEIKDGVLIAYKSHNSDVTIPDGVISIGEGAFSHSDLSSVTISDSVTSIGEWAFWQCDNLSSVTIPNSVTSIAEFAFNGCKNLRSVTFSGGLTSIGDYAFSGCENLSSVTIPSSVTSLGTMAFDTSTKMIAPKNSYAAKWCRDYSFMYECGVD